MAFRPFHRFGNQRIRVDPTPTLSSTLRNAFYNKLKSGDIEELREMLENERLLAQARTRDRETPLFIASVHPDTSKAVEMIDLLMENGAVLGSRDLRKRNVLLYVCHFGVEWEVVEALMKWNAVKGGGILKWSHCDEDDCSSLILAAKGGHTRLALHLLDKTDLRIHAQQNHPFLVLQTVIESGSEPHALAIVAHPKITARLATNTAGMLTFEPYNYTLAKCTEAAIRQEMTDVLQFMDRQNHAETSNATWVFLQQDLEEDEANAGAINPVVVAIADQYAKDQRWANVKGLFLIRYRGLDANNESEQLRSHVLVRVPDQVFRLIAEFVRQKELRRRETVDDILTRGRTIQYHIVL